MRLCVPSFGAYVGFLAFGERVLGFQSKLSSTNSISILCKSPIKKGVRDKPVAQSLPLMGSLIL